MKTGSCRSLQRCANRCVCTNGLNALVGSLLTYTMTPTSKTSTLLHRKPDTIVWVEELIRNNLEDSAPDPLLISATSVAEPLGDSPPKRGGNDEEGNAKISPKSHVSISSPSSSSGELKIGIAEIELKDESFLGDERMQTLSRIVTGRIKYFIEDKTDEGDNEDERFQYWIIKLPTLLQPQRQLSQSINAARREIAFYTDILPDVKKWVESRNIEEVLEFRVPTCFYGRFSRPVDQIPDLDIITHILDSESILVLDDLRASGFGKRHFSSGLSLPEAMAAVEEIVKFHAVTWAMQRLNGRKLSWPALYGWQEIAKLYHTLLEAGLPTFYSMIRSRKHPHAKQIADRIASLEPRLLKHLLNLLKPAENPLPNTLVHMDLWSENLLFRTGNEDDERVAEDKDLTCCIIDWQMVTYGRPTHDLALLIMLSMEPESRREHSELLLQYYFELFSKIVNHFGLTVPFEYEMLRSEFEKSCSLATLMALASIDVILMEESAINRLLEAVADLIEDSLI